MSSNKIFKLGAILGLKPKDIRKLVLDKTIKDKKKDIEAPSSPVDAYIKGITYGTISIKDF